MGGHNGKRWLALTRRELGSLVALLGMSKRDLRDRALLLLGFHGAFRRSELSAVNCRSIVWSRQGVVVTIPKSKTDQEAKGSGRRHTTYRRKDLSSPGAQELVGGRPELPMGRCFVRSVGRENFRRQLCLLIAEIAKDHGPVMADRVLAYVRKAFNWQ
jgi:integrase